MSDLRTAAKQALEALKMMRDQYEEYACPACDHADAAIYALKEALTEDAMQKFTDVNQELMAALGCDHCNSPLYAAVKCRVCGRVTEPVQEPVEFDHGIGADRFKVVRGAFWWHVLIGDSPTEHGKFRSRASAEKMAADLLREFRNGAFVQHESALAEPVQEPVAWSYELATTMLEHRYDGWEHLITRYKPNVPEGSIRNLTPLFAAPPQRLPLTDDQLDDIAVAARRGNLYDLRIAIERAHGITS